MDLAVGVIIGGAFTAIVNSLVSDLIMPIISIFTGGVDFSEMKWQIPVGQGTAYFAYGSFINAVVQFLLIALVVFFLVRGMNRLHKKAEAVAAPVCPFCKEEIKAGATRCPHCAGELPHPAEVASTDSETSVDGAAR